jgi:hypothetical protein
MQDTRSIPNEVSFTTKVRVDQLDQILHAQFGMDLFAIDEERRRPFNVEILCLRNVLQDLALQSRRMQ